MAEGKDTYVGLAVPLQGNFEITSLSTTLDIMTLTQAGGGTSDFIVCQTSGGTEMFVVEDAGKLTIGGEGLTVTSGGLTITAGGATITAGDVGSATGGDVVVGDGYYLRFSSADITTVPTTGLSIGDFFVYQAANTYTVAVAVDNQGVWDAALA
jgi:hypothetical protein